MMTVLAIVLVPAIGRNLRVLHRPVLFTSGGMNAWIGNGYGTVGEAWEEMRGRVANLGETRMDSWFYEQVRKGWPGFLKRAPSLLADKIRTFLSPTAAEPEALSYRLLWPLMLFGFLLARMPGTPGATLMLRGVVLSQFALALAMVPWARYRYPVEPLLWPFAAWTLLSAWGSGRRGRLALALVLALNGAILAAQLWIF
jgi:hypothetical protein